MKYPLSITMSRFQNSRGPDGISVYIEDRISGTRLIDGTMSLESFGRMITGLGSQDATAEVSFANIGKIPECKEEQVFVPDSLGYGKLTSEQLDAVLSRHEVDGWRGDRSDVTNHHRFSCATFFNEEKGKFQRVTFRRYVEPTEEMMAERIRKINEYR